MVFYRHRHMVQISYKKYWMIKIMDDCKRLLGSIWFNNNNKSGNEFIWQKMSNNDGNCDAQNHQPFSGGKISLCEIQLVWFLNIWKLWYEYICVSWLRWWQIQSVEIQRCPAQLPLNTLLNTIGHTNQNRYKNTNPQRHFKILKLIRYIFTKKHKYNGTTRIIQKWRRNLMDTAALNWKSYKNK